MQRSLQGMELNEKESQKGKVYARNVRFGLLGKSWEFLSFGAGGLGNLLRRHPMGFWANPQIIFRYLTLISL